MVCVNVFRSADTLAAKTPICLQFLVFLDYFLKIYRARCKEYTPHRYFLFLSLINTSLTIKNVPTAQEKTDFLKLF